MKTVGIISMYYGCENYGGVLQALALNILVEQQGAKACQILYRHHSDTSLRQLLRQKGLRYCAKRFRERLQTKFCRKILKAEMMYRHESFQRFKQRHIRDSGKVYDKTTIDQVAQMYDGFLCGSDQIWNPTRFDDAYFLGFVPDGKMKASYAASLAVTVPEKQREHYRQALSKLSAVSVREASSADELAAITSQKVCWVLDPVLTLPRTYWQNISLPRSIEEPYLLCYFLSYSSDFGRLAHRFAKNKGLRIVTIPCAGIAFSMSEARFGDIRCIDADPAEFLSLIQNAAYVMTDSFHATAFSLIFQKEFWSFQRTAYTMPETRITDLLHFTGLDDRYVSNVKKFSEYACSIDYDEVERRMEEKRSESLDYLRNCLKEMYENDQSN